MSHFLDRLTFFKREDEPFAAGYGITTHEDQVGRAAGSTTRSSICLTRVISGSEL